MDWQAVKTLQWHLALGTAFRELLGRPLDPLIKKALWGQLSADELAELEKQMGCPPGSLNAENLTLARSMEYWNATWAECERIRAEAQKRLADEVKRLRFLYGENELRRITQALEKRLGPQRRRSRRTTNRVDWNSADGRVTKLEIRTLHELWGVSQLDACTAWQGIYRANRSMQAFVELDAQSLRKQVFDRDNGDARRREVRQWTVIWQATWHQRTIVPDNHKHARFRLNRRIDFKAFREISIRQPYITSDANVAANLDISVELSRGLASPVNTNAAHALPVYAIAGRTLAPDPITRARGCGILAPDAAGRGVGGHSLHAVPTTLAENASTVPALAMDTKAVGRLAMDTIAVRKDPQTQICTCLDVHRGRVIGSWQQTIKRSGFTLYCRGEAGWRGGHINEDPLAGTIAGDNHSGARAGDFYT
jgi:hypothetical protein